MSTATVTKIDPATLATREDVFKALGARTIELPEAEKRLAEIFAADAAKIRAEEQAKQSATVTLKVGPSGTLAVYGLGRNPVALYLSQWENFERSGLVVLSPAFRSFVAKNEHLIAKKDDSGDVQAQKAKARIDAGIRAASQK